MNDTFETEFSNKNPTIYLCSSSKLKYDAVRKLYDMIIKVNDRWSVYDIVQCKMPDKLTPSQPINEGTAHACLTRIMYILQHMKEDSYIMKDCDHIISFENGIYADDDTEKCFDICVMMIYDAMTNKITRYNSTGVKIDPILLLSFCDPKFNVFEKLIIDETFVNSEDIVLTKKNEIYGCDITFGEFLHNNFDVSATNWMKDPRFGNIDRSVQIQNVCDKYLIDLMTERVADYPKKGVIFKHISSIMIQPLLLDTLYNLLERTIANNFNVNEIDYFAGLDARGFYFGTVLARKFKKAFIPIRKNSKIPKTDDSKIATVKYKTEYSADAFGLEYAKEFIAVNGIKKNVLILDDLLATGGSLIAAAKLIIEVGMNVLGACTIYDVPELRQIANVALKKQGLYCQVLINENNIPTDFSPLGYKIPELMIKRIKKIKNMDINSISTIFNEDQNELITNPFTMTPEQWILSDNDNDNENMKNLRNEQMNKVKIIHTEKEKILAEKIIDILKKQCGANISNEKIVANVLTGIFSNGETQVQINENVRDMHVIIISQIRTGHINDDMIELLLILDACKRASASKITVVLPYYPYSRSDKKDHPRCPISAAVVAKLLKNMYVDNLISLDLHAGQIQGFIDHGFHNLYIRNYMCDYIYNNYLKFYEKDKWNESFILIAPDAGSARAIKCYSTVLGINNIILDKQRDYTKPGTVINSRFIGSKEEFKNKTGLLIDDIADTFGTMCSAAKELVNNGMKDVIVLVTHGVLSGPAIERINNTPYIKEVVVTDSLPQENNIIRSAKIRVLTCSELISRSIDGILTGRSISRLF